MASFLGLVSEHLMARRPPATNSIALASLETGSTSLEAGSTFCARAGCAAAAAPVATCLLPACSSSQLLPASQAAAKPDTEQAGYTACAMRRKTVRHFRGAGCGLRRYTLGWTKGAEATNARQARTRSGARAPSPQTEGGRAAGAACRGGAGGRRGRGWAPRVVGRGGARKPVVWLGGAGQLLCVGGRGSAAPPSEGTRGQAIIVGAGE